MRNKFNLLLIVSGLLFLIGGMANGIMDTLQFHHSISIFHDWGSWWDPSISWSFKYYNGDPNLGPKFFLSTTLLVFVTDAWHFFQFVYLWSFTIGATLLVYAFDSEEGQELPIWFFVLLAFIIRLLGGVGFYLSYNLLFV